MSEPLHPAESHINSLPSSPPAVRIPQGPFPPVEHDLNDPSCLQLEFSLHSDDPYSPQESRHADVQQSKFSPDAEEVILGLQERIARLETAHTGLSIELETTRHAMASERRRSAQLDPAFAGPHQNALRLAIGVTLEHQSSLQRQLAETTSELRRTQVLLNASEQHCTNLATRISLLQRNMTDCVDSSSAALEVEQKLRFDIENHVRDLSIQNIELQEANRRLKHDLEAATGARPLSEAPGSMSSPSSVPASLRSVSPANTSADPVADSTSDKSDILTDTHLRIMATKVLRIYASNKICEYRHKKSSLSMVVHKTPERKQDVITLADTLESSDSSFSTVVATPSPPTKGKTHASDFANGELEDCAISTALCVNEYIPAFSDTKAHSVVTNTLDVSIAPIIDSTGI
ncbi:hypothetical protein FISHEDRAFT_57000 [Fistulina hepatica ATCC 64428]|nr:hypothetical protein FISHEDRAFT_57000 [Fistulina hepatica ATCC 64428]